MAVSHIDFNRGTVHGSQLRQAIDQLERGVEGLGDILAVMARMIDGDVGVEANYAYMQDKFGFASNAAAKAAFDELNSLNFKLTTDAQVVEVKAAMLQVFSKFR